MAGVRAARGMPSSWLPVAVLLSLVGAVLLSLLLYSLGITKEREKSEYIEDKLRLLDARISATVSSLSRFSEYIFSNYLDESWIARTMAEAASSSPARRAELRDYLYRRLLPWYQSLARYDFKQVAFHLPDDSVFLRMHKPDVFGDDQSDLRETVRRVNSTGEGASAFELGHVPGGYRFVFPIADGGRQKGAVEVSLSVSAFLRILREIDDSGYVFLLDKGAVESAVLPEFRGTFIESGFSDKYLFDRDVHTDASYAELFARNASLLEGLIESDVDSGVFVEHAGRGKLILARHLRNLGGRTEAYLVSVAGDDLYATYDSNFASLSALALGIYVLLVAFSIAIVNERDKLKRLSTTDNLTGLANRSVAVKAISAELSRKVRYLHPFSILMIDLDDFKKVNDLHGHAEGDAVLRNFAAVLRKSLRSADISARWGGEEFLVILPETEEQRALLTAQKLCEITASSALSPKRRVTVSVGCAQARDEDTIDSITVRADDALYEAKKRGKNRAVGSED